MHQRHEFPDSTVVLSLADKYEETPAALIEDETV